MRLTGRVTNIVWDKKSCFIEEAGEHYFAHKTSFVRAEVFDALAVGESVSFEAVDHGRGARAEQVAA